VKPAEASPKEILGLLGFPNTTKVHSVESMIDEDNQSVVRFKFTCSKGEQTLDVPAMIVYLAARKIGDRDEAD